MHRTAFFTAALLAVPHLALACPVCFGQNDTPMGNAVKAGVVLMLVLVGLVLSGFAAFIVQLNRRARMLAEHGPAAFGSAQAGEPGHYGQNVHKGTV